MSEPVVASHHAVIPSSYRTLSVPARKYPFATCCGVILVSIILGAIGALAVGFDDGGAGSGRFSAIVEESSRYDIYLTLQKDIQKKPIAQTERSVAAIRSFFMYVHDENVFTHDNLVKIQKFEKDFVGGDGYKDVCVLDAAKACTQPGLSVASVLSDAGGAIKTGADLTSALNDLDTSPLASFFVARAAKLTGANPTAPYTRSAFFFGSPLHKSDSKYGSSKTYKNQYDEPLEQEKIIGQWVRDSHGFSNTGTDLGGGLKAYHFVPWLSNEELGAYINQDIALVTVAAVLVVVVMALQMQSNFLGALGLLQIFMSLPFAYFLYRVILGIRLFPTLNMLTLFLVLALGADNCFVLHAFWLHSEHEVADPKDRVAYVVWRGVSSIGTTNATTLAAFVSTGLSNIPSMSSFGWFAACAVFANFFVGVPFVFPAVLLMWEQRFRHKNCVGKVPFFCSLCKSPEANSESSDSGYQAGETHIAPDEHGCTIHGSIGERKALDRWFFNTYAPFLEKYKWPMIAVLGAAIITLGVLALNLEPPASFVFELPEDSAFNGFVSRSDKFRASNEDTVNQIHFVFPSQLGLDRVNDLNDNINLGNIMYQDFTLKTEAQQEGVITACEALEAEPAEMLLGKKMDCPLRDFKAYRLSTDGKAAEVFPVPEADFGPALKTWLEDKGALYASNFSFKDSHVNAFILTMNSTVPLDAKIADAGDQEKLWVELADKVQAKVGTTLPFFQTSLMWVNLVTTAQLQAAALQSVAISLGLAFIVLFIVTKNITLSMIAGSVVAFIVVAVLGLLEITGHDFDVIVSICVSMLAGLSIDYALHYAVGYLESGATTRYGRMRSTVAELGPSILGGAATTLLSASLLLNANFLFFRTFGTAVFMSIALAFAFSNLLLLPMLAAMGPAGVDKFGFDNGSFMSLWWWMRNKATGAVPTIDGAQEDGKSSTTGASAVPKELDIIDAKSVVA